LRVPASSQAIDHDWPRFIHSSFVSHTFRLTTHNNFPQQKQQQNTNSMSTTQQQQPASAYPYPPPTNPSYEAKPDIVYGVEEQEVSPNARDEVNNTNNENPHTKRELRGAAVAGGLIGLLLGGPIVGAVAAGGVGLAATTKGQAGKVSRASGEAVSIVGDRMRKINKKHHVVEKTSEGVVQGFNWVSKRVKPKDVSTRPPVQAN
jgi:hypothetical protein